MARYLKIIIQALNYPPEFISTGKYTGEMAEWLVARGHEVGVITTPPDYPKCQSDTLPTVGAN